MMMKTNFRRERRKKQAAVGFVVCLAVAVAMSGAFAFRRFRNRSQMQPTNAEPRKEETLPRIPSGPVQTAKEADQPTPKPTPKATLQISKEVPSTHPKAVQTSTQPDALAFSTKDVLKWPVEGNVLMNYSMDKTIYFTTLDQYKYNPALIIGGEVGADVVASARGIVKSIEEKPQTGVTMTMELGNGYEAIYGQLKDVAVKEGKYVEQGAVIGHLSEPTKYYSVEGCNLYFELKKDGVPVNPMEYVES